MTTDNGGPAFPVDETDSRAEATGMTLRDYFAGQALKGKLTRATSGLARGFEESMAQESYKLADAMLAERNKGDKP